MERSVGKEKNHGECESMLVHLERINTESDKLYCSTKHRALYYGQSTLKSGVLKKSVSRRIHTEELKKPLVSYFKQKAFIQKVQFKRNKDLKIIFNKFTIGSYVKAKVTLIKVCVFEKAMLIL